MDEFTEQVVVLKPSEILTFCGQNDRHIREIDSCVEARIVVRGNEVRIQGSKAEVATAAELIGQLLETLRRSGGISREQFRFAMRSVRREASEGADAIRDVPGGTLPALPAATRTLPKPPPSPPVQPPGEGGAAAPSERRERLTDLFLDAIEMPHRKRRRITPLTAGQKRYVDMIRQKDIVFGIGPAGTGKTYLAMAMAVWSLVSGAVGRIILVRPAVEAGERLGFLPGDIAQKFDPYVRPLWDALYEMMEAEPIKQAIDNGVIEIAPLAFMRGRTLNNSFVILDEAQNTTVEQMKMFLTRLGFESKAVVTGDVTQIDLPPNTRSGLIHVQTVLKDIEGIGFQFLREEDVVRHELVQQIIRAYERAGHEEGRPRQESGRGRGAWPSPDEDPSDSRAAASGDSRLAKPPSMADAP